jgi:hypothetical protein
MLELMNVVGRALALGLGGTPRTGAGESGAAAPAHGAATGDRSPTCGCKTGFFESRQRESAATGVRRLNSVPAGSNMDARPSSRRCHIDRSASASTNLTGFWQSAAVGAGQLPKPNRPHSGAAQVRVLEICIVQMRAVEADLPTIRTIEIGTPKYAPNVWLANSPLRCKHPERIRVPVILACRWRIARRAEHDG